MAKTNVASLLMMEDKRQQKEPIIAAAKCFSTKRKCLFLYLGGYAYVNATKL